MFWLILVDFTDAAMEEIKKAIIFIFLLIPTALIIVITAFLDFLWGAPYDNTSWH